MAAYEPNFSWRVNGLQSVSADVAGKVFDDIEQSGTKLTPQAVVDASRDEDAPLHGEFEWDDSIAAEKFRCEQARKMIVNLVIVKATDQDDDDEDDESGEEQEATHVRAYVSVPDGKNVYHTMQATLNNEVWKAHLLMTARREMEQFLAKYRRIEELATVVDAIDEYFRVG